MTGIPALRPATSVLPNAVKTENSPKALSTTLDFQSQLKAQSKPPLLPPGPAIAQVLAESTTDMSRRPDVEAMLQSLAWRKPTLNTANKLGRSVPGVLASGLAVPDYSFADHTFLVAAKMINLARADEHSSVLCPELMEGPSTWPADSDGSDFTAGVCCEGGLNAAAIAVALSGSTLIWIPSETVRAPLQSPRIQIGRRRKPPSAEGLPPDLGGAEVDHNPG